MVNFILSGIQNFVNLLFFVAIVGTLGVSWVYASRLKKQYGAIFRGIKRRLSLGSKFCFGSGLRSSGEFLKRSGCQLSSSLLLLLCLSHERSGDMYE